MLYVAIRRSTVGFVCLVSVMTLAWERRGALAFRRAPVLRRSRSDSTTCGYHIRMTGGTRRRMRLVWAGVLLAYFPSSACSPARPPIALSEGTVIVQNQTKQEWR